MTTSGLTIKGAMEPGFEAVLTPSALAFVESLVRTFTGRVDELLAARRARAKGFETADGWDFLPETASVRAGDWKVAALPADLLDRRVEITGPVERKMIINALNSGANVFMADFEDANSPTWLNQVTGQINLMDAVRRRIEFTDPKSGKQYRLNANPAVLFVRPRGWHLRERHVEVDGRDVPGGLFDFGLFFFHNAREQLARGTGPYFYLPKMEHHLEARLWNDVFLFAQEALGVPRGSIKATVLIETLPAAFQMDEILYELREHSAGLNCGRWDYIFSFIKKRAADPTSLLPDRGQVTMDRAFLKAYAQLLIRTCHRRGVHAMGGMAAQIPIKDDPAANEAALARVRADKLREVSDGHDGTWVAHPGLVAVAREIFDAHMPTPNQISRLREDVNVTRADLLVPHTGTRTEAGLRHNVRVGIQYIESWLRGNGCVPLYNLMEDAATAEIARAQVWQWVRYGVALEDGSVVTAARLRSVIDEEMARIGAEQGAARMERGRFADARRLFEELSTAPTFEEFLTLPAYQMLG
jgi:malate synthase